MGMISGAIATLGVIMIVAGALLDRAWMIYTGVVFLISGGAAYKFMGI